MKRQLLGPMLAIGIAAAATGAYAQHERKSMGVTLQGQGEHIFITQVDPGGPAEKVGLKVGDQIESIAGISTERLDPAVLRIIVDTAKAMKFVVWRNDRRLTFSLTPGMYVPPTIRPKPELSWPDRPRTNT
jgi:predicted metalloprotease with PDZ domain